MTAIFSAGIGVLAIFSATLVNKFMNYLIGILQKYDLDPDKIEQIKIFLTSAVVIFCLILFISAGLY